MELSLSPARGAASTNAIEQYRITDVLSAANHLSAGDGPRGECRGAEGAESRSTAGSKPERALCPRGGDFAEACRHSSPACGRTAAATSAVKDIPYVVTDIADDGVWIC